MVMAPGQLPALFVPPWPPARHGGIRLPAAQRCRPACWPVWPPQVRWLWSRPAPARLHRRTGRQVTAGHRRLRRHGHAWFPGCSSSQLSIHAPAPPTVLRCVEKNLTTAVASYQNGGGQAVIVLQLTNAGTAPCPVRISRPGAGTCHRIASAIETHGARPLRRRPARPDHPGAAAVSDLERRVRRRLATLGWAYDLEVARPTPLPCRHPAVLRHRGAGGDIHATAMARHTTIVRGSPGGSAATLERHRGVARRAQSALACSCSFGTVRRFFPLLTIGGEASQVRNGWAHEHSAGLSEAMKARQAVPSWFVESGKDAYTWHTRRESRSSPTMAVGDRARVEVPRPHCAGES